MAAPARPRRAASSSARLLRRLLPRRLLLLPAALLLFLLLPYTPGVLLRRANSLGRRCLPLPHAAAGDLVLLPRAALRLKIAIVTLSDEGAASGSDQDHGRRGRSFRGVLAATARNKRSYAAANGYGLAVLPAASVDPRRPPSWSKVLALRAHLRHHHWLFWNDADTLVTNPDIPLEMILFSVIGHSDFDAAPDLILTEDFNGVNAGVFFIRGSKWSEKFLDTWWNLTSFIQFGSTKSGDNAALKHLIDHFSPEEMQEHVRIAKMQCLFNSYPWRPTWKSMHRLIFHLSTTWKE
ncbi:alpha-1,2-galactosyltransferase gmh3-like isoform X2 [Oryza glaberrima]|uniref:alpha-1,2-galactosyltransferase gmh3-like isoform X2 n=1 Tax=Oryza glaberrima TaxID=4538 RepID=UPI00224C0FBE|nr:alpha-1,2-galactosyltransferase gmh3-like isoform X2 [Oryza glaberrima]